MTSARTLYWSYITLSISRVIKTLSTCPFFQHSLPHLAVNTGLGNSKEEYSRKPSLLVQYASNTFVRSQPALKVYLLALHVLNILCDWSNHSFIDEKPEFDYSARLYRDSPPPGPCSYAMFSLTLKQGVYFHVRCILNIYSTNRLISNPLQYLERSLQEIQPRLTDYTPTTVQPVRFTADSTTATLVLPPDTPGWMFYPDRGFTVCQCFITFLK